MKANELFPDNKFIVATSNPGKLKEIGSILNVFGFEFIGVDPRVEETGSTFIENAKIKAIAVASRNSISDVAKQNGVCVLAEDSGLCIPALNGSPGIFSARFSKQQFPNLDDIKDREKIDLENNKKVLALMKGIGKREAYFEVAFVICNSNGVCLFHKCARYYGTISEEMRGTNGFGYDPIFIGSDTFGKTLAEVDAVRKNLRSHRKTALGMVKLFLSSGS